MEQTLKTRRLVLAAIFGALIIVMTVVPFTGYIQYGGVIEITTLHIVVMLGAVTLGWKWGAILGGIWGVTCLIRAFTNPMWAIFINPLISVLPRILVGVIAGLLFIGLKKLKLNKYLAAMLTAVITSIAHTAMVLSAMYFFGGTLNPYADFYETFKAVFTTIIGINGLIEVIAAAVLVPAIYTRTNKFSI